MSDERAIPPDVALARSVRAATQALGVLAATTLVLGLVGAGALRMAGVEASASDPAGATLLPGVTMLGLGQLTALVGAGLAGWVLLYLLRDRVTDPTRAVRGLSRALGICAWVCVAACVVGIAAWAIVRPGAILPAVLGSLVSVQVAVVIGVLRTRVLPQATAAA
ncbi:hypothetical protein Bcav_3286 [Beutenbergia cavernae DSM 12333]|uniref:Uncharacterized protein n=1 Tax=Beutenbergia cavernae (strain ATCC BAA-8 / DSM 12333 / CCUG 43141 / JCM 11478 / NBRC 16432 / NCIMB 13614 / HKI 0122) TaxID=471853 RepID=C5C1B9_BEUC1|nr:hypothetical protein [Beutenbergia cavernae]ACQ81529.1 hypothetical protein Bcav_3286 [Beutenbergia cavernae DSM 12333]